jgi:hypothetical protein
MQFVVAVDVVAQSVLATAIDTFNPYCGLIVLPPLPVVAGRVQQNRRHLSATPAAKDTASRVDDQSTGPHSGTFPFLLAALDQRRYL